MADESARAARLLDAQNKAVALFAEVESRGLIAAGRAEREVSDAIRDLANEMFDVKRFWHKRIVRSGPNTLQPYRQNPPDRVIAADDIVFADFGPIFEEWEADFGRTFVLGDDPVKHRLRDDLPRVFAAGRRVFESRPDVTGEQLYARGRPADRGGRLGVRRRRTRATWSGEFPHEKIDGDDIESYIAPGSTARCAAPTRTGQQCHWILEIHLVDRERGFGGFHEELLDLG